MGKVSHTCGNAQPEIQALATLIHLEMIPHAMPPFTNRRVCATGYPGTVTYTSFASAGNDYSVSCRKAAMSSHPLRVTTLKVRLELPLPTALHQPALYVQPDIQGL
jgi:hypothetical protein